MSEFESLTVRLRKQVEGQFTLHRILVIDDNRDTVDSEALLLAALGQDVRRAYDGASAVRIATEFKPDIILLDLDMPGMNGFDVARHLSALPWMERTRLIAYTGFGREEYRAAAEAAGFDDFILKPGTIAQRLALLKDA